MTPGESTHPFEDAQHPNCKDCTFTVIPKHPNSTKAEDAVILLKKALVIAHHPFRRKVWNNGDTSEGLFKQKEGDCVMPKTTWTQLAHFQGEGGMLVLARQIHYNP